MQASRKIKLTYPSVESFSKEYKNSIQFGGLYIPTKKPAQLNDIIQITLTIPEIEEPLVINARVVQVNTEEHAQETGQKPGMALQPVEKDMPVIEGLKAQLQGVEIYRKLLDLPPPVEKPPPVQEPAAPEKAEPDIKAAVKPEARKKPAVKTAAPPAREMPPEKKIREQAAPEAELPPKKPVKRVAEADWEPVEEGAKPEPPIEAPGEPLHEKELETEAFPEEVEPPPKKAVRIAAGEPVHKAAQPGPPPRKPEDKPPGPSISIKPDWEPKPVAARAEAPQKGLIHDQPIEKLRKMIGDDDSLARPARKEVVVTKPRPEPPRRTLSEQERRRLTPVAKLAMTLVKAMLRTGYYSPDHPGSQDAKKGLYSEFLEAIQEQPEISFISRITREQTDILVGGILEEPVSLRTVIPGSQAEMFFPKYKDYFERKRLVNFTIKRDIDEGQFDSFIDVMSDPEVDKGEGKEAGKILTAALARRGIANISAVFEDDMIRLELKLPWRVEMAINRLAKDLKMLPMYHDVSRDQMQRLKKQIISDIIRPLRQPHMMKDILVNAHVIARKVQDLDPEDLEKTIISCFPMELLLPTSEFIFTEMTTLKGELEKHPDAEALKNRIEGIKRVLKHISLRVVEEKIEEGMDFLEQLYFHEILTFEELPEPVQERINTIRMTEDFQKNSYYYISKFKEARVRDDYMLLLRLYRRILPELIDGNDYQNIFMITQAVSEAADRDPATLKDLRGDVDNEVWYIWSNSLAHFKQKFLTEKKETRTGLDEVLVLLGSHGIELLIQVLEESEDRWVRKSAIDLLIKYGDRARNYFREILDDPAKPWTLHRNALFIIGNIGDADDIERATRFMRHSDARLREESLNAISRLEGPAAEPKLIRYLRDNDHRVRRRAAACLGLFNSISKNALAELIKLAQGPEKPAGDEKTREAEEAARIQAIHTLGLMGNQPVDAEHKVEDVLIELITPGKGWAKKLMRRVAKVGEQSERILTAVVDTLSKIGANKSIEALDSLLETSGSALTSKIKDALRQIEARTTSGDARPSTPPAAPAPGPVRESAPAPAVQPKAKQKAASTGADEVLELEDEIEELTEETN